MDTSFSSLPFTGVSGANSQVPRDPPYDVPSSTAAQSDSGERSNDVNDRTTDVNNDRDTEETSLSFHDSEFSWTDNDYRGFVAASNPTSDANPPSSPNVRNQNYDYAHVGPNLNLSLLGDIESGERADVQNTAVSNSESGRSLDEPPELPSPLISEGISESMWYRTGISSN